MEPNSKKKICIIDDDNFLLDMYALKFNQNNFEVYTAPGAVQALEKVRGGLVPDIILLDVVMPEMDGFQFLETLNKENLLRNTIKIILSNRGQQSDIEHGEQLGASGYIVKANSTPAEIVARVIEMVKAGAEKPPSIPQQP